MSVSEFYKAKAAAFKFLSLRSRSVFEVRQRLLQKGYDAATTCEVIERLQELKYLDDEAFALKMAEDLVSAKGCGSHYIADKLKKKGIQSETVRQAIDVAFSEIDEKERARELVLRKKKGKPNTPHERGRLERYLQSKGYGWDTIQCVMQELNDRERD